MAVITPQTTLSLHERLLVVHDKLAATITRLKPERIAVEEIFHATNARSALILGHVRGVVLLAAAQAHLPVRSFAPASVKASVCGYGRAEKSQVAFMVARLLGLSGEQPAGDATDALAVALCAAHSEPWAPRSAVASRS
jgi:crossover junction endodeoxyribonuclease RuvC